MRRARQGGRPWGWPLAGVILAATLLGAAGPAVAADPLRSVGDERPVGRNRTGEECRLRLVDDRAASQRFNLYCEGWTQPSGRILRFRVSRESTPERLVTDSGWQKGLAERLGDCGPAEKAALASGAPAALRECKRVDGGWRVLILASVVAGRAYALETFPTNMPLLELGIEVLEGKRALDQGSGAPLLSAVIRRAETMVGATGRLIGIQDVGAHATLSRLGRLQFYAGAYAESEATLRRALEIEERVAGPDQPQSGDTLSWIALTAGVLGRFDEADRLFARAEPLVQRSFSEDDRGRYLGHRAATETRRGNAAAALRYAQAAVQSRESSLQSHGVKTLEGSGLAHALTVLGRAQALNKDFDAAEKAMARAVAMVDKPGPDPEYSAWWTAVSRLELGRIHVAQQRFADARRQYLLALERFRLLFGESANAALALSALGQVARLEGDLPGALQAYRQLAAIQTREPGVRDRVRPASVVGYLETLVAAAATASPAEREGLHAEALLAAQIPRGSGTARAITNMAARLDAADPAIRAVARQHQEASRERDRARQALALETLKPPDKREPPREEKLEQDLRAAEAKVARLEARLQAEHPRYARLTAPRPTPAAEVAQALREGEALLAFLPTREATFVFLLRDGRVDLHRAAIPLADLERLVRQVRAGLEVQDGQLRPFDVAAAHRLYQALVAPVAGRLRGVTHLVTVPAGPLLSLPLGLLPAAPDPPAAPGDYRQTAWLAREFAISVLPATASLGELRQVAARSAAPRPFIGFGDPAFAGAEGETRGMAALAALCRQGAPVDTDLVRGLARLPETGRELRSIAQTLGADAGSVILGERATETAVRAADLAQYRVLAFATHGLLPGELRCKAEPALALTPPAAASAGDDGLLDAGEVAQLRLDADWVVLSACNTAGPDGKLGGESLSGLARAFFYAGARALLVSHWAVASRATVALTTGMFAAHARSPAAGQAEALRQAQLALAGRADTSHPFFWAAFTLVGG